MNKQSASETSVLSTPKATPNLSRHPNTDTWFPALKEFDMPDEKVRGHIICFHCSGAAENIYTKSGTKARRIKNGLVDIAKSAGLMLLGCQMPGREKRRKETMVTSLVDLAEQVGPVLERLGVGQGKPYFMIGHSMGTWAAYEVMRWFRARKFDSPQSVFMACFPSPWTTQEQTPWLREANLNDSAFRNECNRWGINRVVFEPSLWKMFEPMLRSDFRLFDSYNHSDGGCEQEAFDSSVIAFYANQDQMISKEMLASWQQVSRKPIKIQEVPGKHLFVYDAKGKTFFFDLIASEIKSALETLTKTRASVLTEK